MILRTFCLFSAAVMLAQAASTEEVLAKMTASAPQFTSMSADVQRVNYTKVLDEKTTETGTIKIRKVGKDLQVLMDVTKPDTKVVAFRGRKAEIYFPKLKTVQEYDLGKHSALVDQFLLVGFGTTGRELQSAYKVKLAGEETINGQKTFKLQLTPNSSGLHGEIRERHPVDCESGEYPVQQQFVQASGDYYLVTYSDVKLNPGLTDEGLRLKVPKGTKRELVNK